MQVINCKDVINSSNCGWMSQNLNSFSATSEIRHVASKDIFMHCCSFVEDLLEISCLNRTTRNSLMQYLKNASSSDEESPGWFRAGCICQKWGLLDGTTERFGIPVSTIIKACYVFVNTPLPSEDAGVLLLSEVLLELQKTKISMDELKGVFFERLQSKELICILSSDQRTSGMEEVVKQWCDTAKQSLPDPLSSGEMCRFAVLLLQRYPVDQLLAAIRTYPMFESHHKR